MGKPDLLDAIRKVKENEWIASSAYADAARKIRNPIGRALFEQLSAFEQFHYEQVGKLEASLEASGEYIDYPGREFPQPPTFEIKAAEEPSGKSVIEIISSAILLEKQSEEAYHELSEQSLDRHGHDMFSRLADEEHKHFRILQEASWSLMNLGKWKWSQ